MRTGKERLRSQRSSMRGLERTRLRCRWTVGFTLLELMIVITILLTLISLAAPIYRTSLIRSKEAVLRDDLFTLRSLIDQYTLDKQEAPQSLQDLAQVSRSGKADLRRMRAAALSIIPSTTGAAKAIGLVLPALKGKLDGMALRVPVPTGSITDLVVSVGTDTTRDEVNAAFAEAAGNPSFRGVLEYTEEPLVSADIVQNPASCIFSAKDTMVNGRFVKALGWYDNEWGYSNRLVDLCAFVAQ